MLAIWRSSSWLNGGYRHNITILPRKTAALAMAFSESCLTVPLAQVMPSSRVWTKANGWINL